MPDRWSQFAQPAPSNGGADKWAKFAQPDAPAPPPLDTSNPNGEGTYKMVGPQGQTVQVPFSKVRGSQDAKYQVLPEDTERYGRDAGAVDSENRAANFHKQLQTNVENSTQDLAPTGGVLHDDVLAPLVHVLNRVGKNAGGIAANVIAPPTYQQQLAAAQQQLPQVDKPLTAGGLVEGAGNEVLPGAGLGSAVRGYAQTVKSGHPGTAALDLLGDGGTAALFAGLGKTLPGEAPVSGENFTPTQLQAHTGLISRSTGLGDNFIPQQAAADTLSTIRQAAADNPQVTTAALRRGSTPENIAAYQNILQQANTALEKPHAATISQFSNHPADVGPIQAAVRSALPDTLAGVAPEDEDALNTLSDRLGTVNTMGGLNDLRQWLNDEASASYKQDGIAANRGAATKIAYRKAADAARNSYFDQLQQHSGIDFQPVKRQQSALMSQQEGLAGVGQKLSAQQGLADEPKSPAQVLSEALTGGRAIKAGPIAGTAQLIAEKALGRTPLTQPNYLIRKALSNLPEPTPQVIPQPAVAPSLLNGGQAVPQLGAPAPPTATVIPPSPPPIPPSSLPSPVPAQLNAPPVQPQLPPGVASRLLGSSASPANIQTPYPALNVDAAATRIVPNKFSNPEIISPSGTRAVTPQGEVLTPTQRFLQSGELDKNITNPSVDDLKRAIAGMRKKRSK